MSSGKDKLKALAELRAQQAKKRTEEFQLKSSASAWQEVSEDEYSRIVEKRREEGFVVGDDGEADEEYMEDDWNAQYSEGEDDDPRLDSASSKRMASAVRKQGAKKPRKAAEDGKDKKKAAEPEKPASKLSSAFFGSSSGSSGPSASGSSSSSSTRKIKSDVSSLLSELDDDPLGASSISSSSSFMASFSPFVPSASSSSSSFSYQPVGAALSSVTKPSIPSAPAREEASFAKPAAPSAPSAVSPPEKKARTKSPERDLPASSSSSSAPPAASAGPISSASPNSPQKKPLPPISMEKVPSKDMAIDSDAASPSQPSQSSGMASPERSLSPAPMRTPPHAPSLSMEAQDALAVDSMELPVAALSEPSIVLNQADAAIQSLAKSEGHLDFFWIDAYEDAYNSPGVVYLFGKVRVPDSAIASSGKKSEEDASQYVSCCIIVRNVPRLLYFLPRERMLDERGKETVDRVPLAEDIREEIEQILRNSGARGDIELRSRMIEKYYAFEMEGIPRGEKSQFLEVRLPPSYPRLKYDIKRARTFRHTFGENTGPLERLLMDRKIMGPTWLRIKDPKFNTTKSSWCKAEATIDDMNMITLVEDANRPKPPLVVCSLSMKTMLNDKKHTNEIIALSAVVSKMQVDGPTPQLKTECFGGVRVVGGFAPPSLKDALKKPDFNPKKFEYCPNERALLSYFMARLFQVDPDVIVGHNFLGFDLDVLLHRMKDNSTPFWSRIGRLNRKEMPKLQNNAGGMGESTWAEKQVMAGRLVCDTYVSAKEHLRERSYALTDLVASQLSDKNGLPIQRKAVPTDPSILTGLFTSPEGMRDVCYFNMMDAQYILMLMDKLQLIPLTKQLTNLAGNLWSKTLVGSRAERIEYLLLHEFTNLGFVVPDKTIGTFNNDKNADNKSGKSGAASSAAAAVEEAGDHDDDEGGAASKGGFKSNAAKRHPKYAGGMVFEPKKGLYDRFVLLLDFNSLYPSIIQEYNVCFTTVERPPKNADGTQAYNTPVPAKSALVCTACSIAVAAGEQAAHADACPHRNILPKVIRTLVDRRRQVKQLIKSTPASDVLRQSQYEIRQKALKLTANSMYGCLGFSHSRFYAQPLAELITSQGRDILQRTRDMAETGEDALNVIYGDTDSVMIYTGDTVLSEAKKKGYKLREKVNKMYRHLEIDIDGIFTKVLLLKKKKYAALRCIERPDLGPDRYEVKEEKKGLDMVRRDWCNLSVSTSEVVLRLILSDKSREDTALEIQKALEETAEALTRNGYPKHVFTITKSLTKLPSEYPDAKNQPHVQVALRMQANGKAVRVGDRIPYIIVKHPSLSSAPSAPSSSSSAAPAAATASSALVVAAPEPTITPVSPPSGEEVPLSSPPSAAPASAPTPAPAAAASAAASSSSATPVTTPAPIPAASAPASGSIAERARHPDEVNFADIDVEWYLSQQVHPPVARLCEHIEGLDAQQIAVSLGLDASKYRSSGSSSDYQAVNAAMQGSVLVTPNLNEEERYKDCTKVSIRCEHCGASNLFPGLARLMLDHKVDLDPHLNVFACVPCGGSMSAARMQSLRMEVLFGLARPSIQRFYEMRVRCEDPTCSSGARSFRFNSVHTRCPDCQRHTLAPEYSASQLFNQLRYLETTFDIDGTRKRLKTACSKEADAIKFDSITIPEQQEAFLRQLHSDLDTLLKRNSRFSVAVRGLFTGIANPSSSSNALASSVSRIKVE